MSLGATWIVSTMHPFAVLGLGVAIGVVFASGPFFVFGTACERKWWRDRGMHRA